MTQLKVYTTVLPSGIQRSQILQWLAHQTKIFLWENPTRTQQLFTAGSVLQADSTRPITMVTAQNLLQEAKTTLELTPSSSWEDVKLVGSFLFDSKDPRNVSWGALQNGIAFIPEVSFFQTAQQWHLTVIATDGARLNEIITTILQLPNLAPQAVQLVNYQEQAVSQWTTAVETAVVQIKQTQLQKVVLARQATAQFTNVNWVAVWLYLSQRQPGYHILLNVPGASFISITPERLASFQPQMVQTGAVAGTIANAADQQKATQLAQQLLHDAKNRHEHDIVVQGIKRVLQQAQLTVQAPATPEILTTANLQHLYTPITGLGLVQPWSIIAQLHPTPALGGMPQQLAVELIRQLEPHARGLFGAPIGYLSAHRTGEFAVGIRSALIKDQQLTFFAGAGIVADSQADSEQKETGLKLQSLYQALQS